MTGVAESYYTVQRVTIIMKSITSILFSILILLWNNNTLLFIKADQSLVCASKCAYCDGRGLGAVCVTCSKTSERNPFPSNEWILDCKCHPNCKTCDGPGENDCRTCIDDYCIEDKSYRDTFYGGLGKCQNVAPCPKASNEMLFMSSAVGSYVVVPRVMLLVSLSASWIIFDILS